MSNSNYRILLVDDEEDIIDIFKFNLEKEGYTIETANNGKEAISKAKDFQPHLILLDVMMDEMDGIEACEEIRKSKDIDDCVIAFLTARTEDYSQIAGFDSGADAYISKPIKPKTLVKQVEGLLRRLRISGEGSDSKTVVGDIEIDKERYIVNKAGEELNLPKKEFELLALLISKPGSVFTRNVILEKVWGNDVVVGDRTIDVHVRKLREKIGDHTIKTVKGVGYKIES